MAVLSVAGGAYWCALYRGFVFGTSSVVFQKVKGHNFLPRALALADFQLCFVFRI